MTDFNVRAAKPVDEPAVLALAQAEMDAHAFSDARFKLRQDAAPRYAMYLHNRMREIDSSVFVAERDGEIVGMVVASIRIQEAFFEPRRFGYVSDLVVVPSARRGGIGKALWGRTTLWFKGLGVGVVRLHIAATADAAVAFWKSIGGEPFLVETWVDLPALSEIPEAARSGSGAAGSGAAGSGAAGSGAAGSSAGGSGAAGSAPSDSAAAGTGATDPPPAAAGPDAPSVSRPEWP